MEKDFIRWHKKKCSIDLKTNTYLFRHREIWWCSLGLNVGSEEDGKNANFERPILIFKKFNRNLFLGLPMTSKVKDIPYHYTLTHGEKEYSILISQIRTLSSKRLIRKIRTVGSEEFSKITQRIKDVL